MVYETMTEKDTKHPTISRPVVRRITRMQAAALLGRGIDAVTYYHGKQLHPVRDHEGRYLYDREEVERLAVVLRRRRPRKKDLPKGELAAEVFRCFDLGISFREIVMRLNIDPEDLRRLRADYEADGAERIPTLGDQIDLEKQRTKLELEKARLAKMELAQEERQRRRRE